MRLVSACFVTSFPASRFAPLAGTHPALLGIDGERSQAARDATDAALRAGLAGRILPAVRAAAQDQPLDEALQSRLVLALAADGHRDQALAAYRAVRERLADELGIDPGPELRAAYARLRRPAVQPVPAAAPAQLPSDHPFFAGRSALIERALASIERQRADGPALLTIDGMPGVGKTTLAIHLAHRLAAGFPDGQLYADLRGYDPRAAVLRPAEVLRGFLTCLGVPPAELPGDLPGLARRHRELLAGRRVLIVLDNCPDAPLIRDLLPGTPGSLVIMTSRAGLAGPGETLRLGLPTVEEARAALALRLGADRLAADPGAVDEIISRCGRLPLALALVAARIATVPEASLAEIAAELAEGAGDADLAAAFSWSYRRLVPAAARLFRLLPLHPGTELTVPSIAALAGVSAPVARLMIGDLVSHALLELRGDRLEMHRLLRAYAAELAADRDSAAEREAATQRIRSYHRARAPHVPVTPAHSHRHAKGAVPEERRGAARAGVLLSIGDAHLEAGDPGRARACWEKALAVLPGDAGPVADELRGRLDRMARAA
ncbi:BTAD domain-containing putative transcriptional regulator [Actinoplanes sp. NPDC024001]|uniref:BTAD domain-containing putative transcriptional regulator n=1 Tax=Actinoplanes sp. NPDC024001 TaxID=3154598 RepID=UPI0033F4D939